MIMSVFVFACAYLKTLKKIKSVPFVNNGEKDLLRQLWWIGPVIRRPACPSERSIGLAR